MVSQKVQITNLMGLHLRPAGLFCQTAMKFESSVKFRTKQGLQNAKSLLNVLGSCVKNGDTIEIICEGSDEQMALQAMVELVESGIGE